MANSYLKKILIAVVSASAIKKEDSAALLNNNGITNELSDKKDNLVDYLLTENKEQFSFIQEDATKIDASYVTLLEQLSQGEAAVNKSTSYLNKPSNVKSMTNDEMEVSTIRQIFIWLPITLVIVLYFVVMSLIDMPIQKNSILYAKYGTTKQLQGAQ